MKSGRTCVPINNIEDVVNEISWQRSRQEILTETTVLPAQLSIIFCYAEHCVYRIVGGKSPGIKLKTSSIQLQHCYRV